MEEFIIDTLKVYFNNEISNEKDYSSKDEIIVFLGDGSKAKIKIKKA